MKLSKLLDNIEYTGSYTDDEVIDIVSDSRKVKKGSLFIAIKGESFDGHSAAADALKNGAVAVITEKKIGLEKEITVEDTRIASALLSSAYFDNPGSKLKLVGVTGTNGKTTVSNIIKQAIENLGHKAGLIGTIQYEMGGRIIPAKYTTPEPWDLNALFVQMVESGCEYAVMEASSQALAQQRLYGQNFELAVFTNLTRDHLDYHKSMEDYFNAKRKLFITAKNCVINVDDEFGRKLFDEFAEKSISYSAKSNMSHYTAKNIEYSSDNVRFALSGDNFIGRVKLNIPGFYSVQNALAASLSLISLGFPKEQATESISSVKGIKGRCETLYNGEFTVMSDFAHTGDALEQLIAGLKPYIEGKLLVLLGCTGDRDAGKRAGMIETVCHNADIVILTSDNPRTEDPEEIISSLIPVLDKECKNYYTEQDREKAVALALSLCSKGDLLLLCGKGHEEYQVMNGYTVYLNERDLVNSKI